MEVVEQMVEVELRHLAEQGEEAGDVLALREGGEKMAVRGARRLKR